MAAKKGIFTKDTFQFLGELTLNNDRDWFAANKDRYESSVREPALQFIRTMAGPLSKVSEHFEARDKKVGGSLMRIHRDVRFGKDKSPYKTNVGIQFRHEKGKDVHAPGYYIHLSMDECFLGMGLWRPESPVLVGIRKAIDKDQSGWKRILAAKGLRENFVQAGDSLKRPPKGFSPDHPLLDELKRKDHMITCELSQKDITSPDFPKLVAQRFKQGKAFMAFLCKANKLKF